MVAREGVGKKGLVLYLEEGSVWAGCASKSTGTLPFRLTRFQISIVTLPPLKGLLPGTLFTGKNLSLEMLKAGWGTVYEQVGHSHTLLASSKNPSDRRRIR